MLPVGLSAAPVGARDIYIGTVIVDGDRVTLERCDLGRTRYRLLDAESVDVVADLRMRPAPTAGFWYAEIIGDHVETGADDAVVSDEQTHTGHVLSVIAIEGLRDGGSCHLLDHLDALDATGAPIP